MNTESDVSIFLVSPGAAAHKIVDRLIVCCGVSPGQWEEGVLHLPTPANPALKPGPIFDLSPGRLQKKRFLFEQWCGRDWICRGLNSLCAHVFFCRQLPLYLPAVYMWEIMQAQFVTKCLVHIFCVYLFMSRIISRSFYCCSEFLSETEAKKPTKPGLSLGRLQFP